jgi:hypothetical protein
MKFTKLCLLSICAAALPLTLNAQQPAQDGPAAPAAPVADTVTVPVAAPAEEATTFGSLDVDEDGRLSLTESEKSARIKVEFGALDINKDSYLSMEEYGKLSPVKPE